MQRFERHLPFKLTGTYHSSTWSKPYTRRFELIERPFHFLSFLMINIHNPLTQFRLFDRSLARSLARPPIAQRTVQIASTMQLLHLYPRSQSGSLPSSTTELPTVEFQSTRDPLEFFRFDCALATGENV